MKNLFTLCLIFYGSATFSQDISKMLQNGKWYPGKDTKTNMLIYSKTPLGKDKEATVEFKENGKMVQCGIYEESSLDATSKEKKSTHFMCDSVTKYEVKNGMLKTQLLKQTPNYYKIAMNNGTIELTPIKGESYK